jgi:hypothetical protein
VGTTGGGGGGGGGDGVLPDLEQPFRKSKLQLAAEILVCKFSCLIQGLVDK